MSRMLLSVVMSLGLLSQVTSVIGCDLAEENDVPAGAYCSVSTPDNDAQTTQLSDDSSTHNTLYYEDLVEAIDNGLNSSMNTPEAPQDAFHWLMKAADTIFAPTEDEDVASKMTASAAKKLHQILQPFKTLTNSPLWDRLPDTSATLVLSALHLTVDKVFPLLTPTVEVGVALLQPYVGGLNLTPIIEASPPMISAVEAAWHYAMAGAIAYDSVLMLNKVWRKSF